LEVRHYYNFRMYLRQILVSAIGLVLVGAGVSACGQKGALYLPTDPAAKDRATLPQVLTPDSPPATGDNDARKSPGDAK
jgi:predicted small lipoprotein YifL